MFGVTSTPEEYQNIIMQVIAGIEGGHNISDDIVVHGKDKKDHDERLHAVLKRLDEKGLTLNTKKCQILLEKAEFMGHELSRNGMCITTEKVKAINDARCLKSASEVRSFLGLVNFCGRYIKNLADISEPMRQLTKKGCVFQ